VEQPLEKGGEYDIAEKTRAEPKKKVVHDVKNPPSRLCGPTELREALLFSGDVEPTNPESADAGFTARKSRRPKPA
jgi:hypothetical protein